MLLSRPLPVLDLHAHRADQCLPGLPVEAGEDDHQQRNYMSYIDHHPGDPSRVQ